MPKAKVSQHSEQQTSHEPSQTPQGPSQFVGPYADILKLQSTIGNRAVTRLIKAQQEENRSGRSRLPPPSIRTLQTPFLQRKCASCGQSTHAIGECEECQKKRSPLQRQAANSAEPGEVPPIVHEVLRSPGQTLDSDTRVFMESRFGQDFNQVRVHTDIKAEESARALNALAYTVGNQIVFGKEQYSPETKAGKQLLAHELVHVTQQRLGGTSALQTKLEISPADSADEREADQVARIVSLGNGKLTIPLHSVQPSIQRTCYRPAELGSVGGCIPQGGDITDVGSSSDQLYLSEVNCDHLQPAEEARLIAFAGAVTPAQRLDIHGFASQEGPTDFNENLSCARAHEAKRILVGEGIDEGQLILYKHGATPGSKPERRSVVVVPTPLTPAPLCGPDATDWFIRQVAAAKTDRAVLDVQADLDRARRLAALEGFSAEQLAEGGVARKVLEQERRAGFPPRTPEARAQLTAARRGRTELLRAGLEAIRDPLSLRSANLAMALLLIRNAALDWKRLVATGARFDFKNDARTMKGPTSPSCPTECSNTITFCPSSASDCFLTDVPGNLFYAHLGRFIGWTELSLQLGSEFAQLASTRTWDPPEDTRMISLGFALPHPLTQSNLCAAITANRSIFTLWSCLNCSESTTADIV